MHEKSYVTFRLDQTYCVDHIREDEMGGVCSTMREDRKAYRVLVVQPEGKDHLYGTGLSGRTVRAAAAVHKPDTQPSAPHHTDNLKTKAPNRTGSNHLCNTLELLMMGIMVLETC